MKPDGTGLHLVVNLDKELVSDVSAPSWSPKGDYISFTGFVGHPLDPYARGSALYVAERDGSNLSKPFTPSLESGAWIASNPTWSPDGRFIAVLEVVSRNLRIRRIEVGGDNIHKVTDTGLVIESDSFEPVKLSWAPDGAWMAFMLERDLYAVAENGLDLRLAFDGADGAKWEPAWSWSPDGSTLTVLSKFRIHSLDLLDVNDPGGITIIIYAISPENPDRRTVVLRAVKSQFRSFFEASADGSVQSQERR